jgi:hypothetical protein
VLTHFAPFTKTTQKEIAMDREKLRALLTGLIGQYSFYHISDIPSLISIWSKRSTNAVTKISIEARIVELLSNISDTSILINHLAGLSRNPELGQLFKNRISEVLGLLSDIDDLLALKNELTGYSETRNLFSTRMSQVIPGALPETTDIDRLRLFIQCDVDDECMSAIDARIVEVLPAVLPGIAAMDEYLSFQKESEQDNTDNDRIFCEIRAGIERLVTLYHTCYQNDPGRLLISSRLVEVLGCIDSISYLLSLKNRFETMPDTISDLFYDRVEQLLSLVANMFDLVRLRHIYRLNNADSRYEDLVEARMHVVFHGYLLAVDDIEHLMLTEDDLIAVYGLSDIVESRLLQLLDMDSTSTMSFEELCQLRQRILDTHTLSPEPECISMIDIRIMPLLHDVLEGTDSIDSLLTLRDQVGSSVTLTDPIDEKIAALLPDILPGITDMAWLLSLQHRLSHTSSQSASLLIRERVCGLLSGIDDLEKLMALRAKAPGVLALLFIQKIITGLDQISNIDILADLWKNHAADPNIKAHVKDRLLKKLEVALPALSDIGDLLVLLDKFPANTEPYGKVIGRIISLVDMVSVDNIPPWFERVISGKIQLPDIISDRFLSKAADLFSELEQEPACV